jgi:type I restriction enzyme S subunit
MSEIKQGYKQTKVGIIPQDWEVKYIEDIAEVKGGKRLPLGHELTETITPYPYIRVTNMSMGGLNDKQILYVPSEVQPKIKNYTISKDDLYIAVAGNTLGMLGTIPAKFDGANLTENADKICNIKMNKEFLLFVLMSDLIQNVIQNEITTNAQPKLALTRIKKFHIPFPPLKEQEKIAEILTTWDEGISNVELLILNYELRKKALMQKLLSGEVRFDGFSDAWEEVRLGDVCNITTGTSKSQFIGEGNYFIIDMGSVSSNGDLIAIKTTSLEKDFLQVGDLIMPKDDIGGGQIIGKVALIQENNKFILGDHVFRIVTKQNSTFLLYKINSFEVNCKLKRKVTGSAQLGLNKKNVEETKLKLPSLYEQQKIAEILSLADDEIILLKNELVELKLQKKALMQKLLTGEVRVEV